MSDKKHNSPLLDPCNGNFASRDKSESSRGCEQPCSQSHDTTNETTSNTTGQLSTLGEFLGFCLQFTDAGEFDQIVLDGRRGVCYWLEGDWYDRCYVPISRDDIDAPAWLLDRLESIGCHLISQEPKIGIAGHTVFSEKIVGHTVSSNGLEVQL